MRVKFNYHRVNIIGDLDVGLRLRKRVLNNLTSASCVLRIEPKRVKSIYEKKNMWYLVPTPDDHNVNGMCSIYLLHKMMNILFINT